MDSSTSNSLKVTIYIGRRCESLSHIAKLTLMMLQKYRVTNDKHYLVTNNSFNEYQRFNDARVKVGNAKTYLCRHFLRHL